MRSLAAVLFSTLLLAQLAHGARRDLTNRPLRTLLQGGEGEATEEPTEEEQQDGAPEEQQDEAPEEPEEEEEKGPSFNYQQAGADWPDFFPDCGKTVQSPINIITADADESSGDELHARFNSFGVGRGVSVFNKGQSVEVTWNETIDTSVLLPVVGEMVAAAVDPLDPTHEGVLDLSNDATFSFANIELLQFHFHMSSENAIDGVLFPLELHLVTRVNNAEICGEGGCIVVFAILFKINDEVNFFLEPFIDAAPDHAGETHAADMPLGFEIVFDELIPENKSFYTWKGSFTTPPCTEGVTWVLFDNFGQISQQQLAALQSKMAAVRETCQVEAAGDVVKQVECNFMGDLKNNRALQPVNSRRIEHVDVVFAS